MNRKEQILKRQFILQIIIPFLITVLLLLVGYFIVHPQIQELLINGRKNTTREMVEGVNKMLEGYNELVNSGKITQEQAKANVISTIRMFRYGKDNANYFWIQDYEGKIIFHPALDSPSGINPSILKSIPEVATKVAQMVKEKGKGFISYSWYSLNKISDPDQKEAYAMGYKNWGWIVGTGFMIHDLENDLKSLSKRVMMHLFLFAMFLMGIIMFVLIRNYFNLQKIVKTDYELKKREARFRGFAEKVDNGLLIKEDGKIVFVNNFFCSIFEITQAEATAFELENFLADWEKDRVKMIMGTSDKADHIEFTTWLKLKTENEKFVNIHYTIDQTNSHSVYLVVQDRTQFKHHLNTIDILSENLAHSSEAIVITDLNGNVEYVNPGFEKVTGYTLDEVKGQKTNVLKSGKMHPAIYKNLWNTISSGNVWRGELLNRKKDGTLFWESTIIFPIKNRNNEIIKYSSIKSDITQNKKIEQELVKARDKAEEINRYKTTFLNNISHEVRTPLNAIYGFIQILRHKPSTNQADNYMQLIDQNCKILLGLFEDIMDMSEIESKAVTFVKEDVLFKDMLLKIVSKYNSQMTVFEKKPVEILVEEDENFDTLVLYTDRKRLSQVFDQLLSNAVKYTMEGHIRVSYKIGYEDITFYISDTGVGIPDRERELIFDSFSHGENLYVSLHKGVGLGLNIAKLLVEMFGGKLSFTSEVDKGSTFFFTFPAIDAKNYRVDGNEIGNYKYHVENKHILIAEDNDENFTYLVMLIGQNNKITRANNGIEAVNLLQDSVNLPDIILMDILMPEMDGITASKMIRELHPNMPIIAISAIANEVEPQEKSLFSYILDKPLQVSLLTDKIRELTS